MLSRRGTPIRKTEGCLRSKRAARTAVVPLGFIPKRAVAPPRPTHRSSAIGRAERCAAVEPVRGAEGTCSVGQGREALDRRRKVPATQTPKGAGATEESNASRDPPARLAGDGQHPVRRRLTASSGVAHRLQVADIGLRPFIFRIPPPARTRPGCSNAGGGRRWNRGERSDGSGPGLSPPRAVHAARGARARRRSRTRKRAGPSRRDHRGSATLGARGEYPREVERGGTPPRRRPQAFAHRGACSPRRSGAFVVKRKASSKHGSRKRLRIREPGSAKGRERDSG